MRLSILPVIACFLVVPAQAKYSGGSGTAQDPYQVATAADLIALGETPADYSKCFILTADIDLDPNLPGRKVFDKAVIAPDINDAPSSWFEGATFTGVFDGNGHTISHLTIRGGSYLGLFGWLGYGWTGAQVKNLGVVDVSIIGTGDFVGGLAGYDDSGTVTECYSSGVVSGNSCVGGLVGMESSPAPGLPSFFITYCYSNCYSTAAVSAATRSAGGLVGEKSCGNIIRCYSTGPVSAPAGAGGLVGGDPDSCAIVTDCFWDIETSGQATSAGGTGKTTQEMQAASTFVQWGACVSVWTIDDGRDYPRLAWENAPGQIIAGPTYAGGTGTAEDPYLIATAEDLNALGLCSCHWGSHFTLTADIDLSGRTWTGAVVPGFWGVFDGNGHIISGLTITGGSYLGLFDRLSGVVKNLGVVDVNIISSGTSVGGLVGENYGSIVASYSTGTVSGFGSFWSGGVGGLVGSNEGDVSRCYSACRVSGDDFVGGLVGSGGNVTSCYSTGSVSGDSSVGGLVGSGGSVTSCYSTGSVSGNSSVGGLVGSGSPQGVIHSIWDIQTSGQLESGGGVGLTTTEMMDPRMLALNGFSSDPNWILDAGRDYPRLAWEGTAGEITPEPNMDWLEGQGTAQEPYRIGTAGQLILLVKASVLWDGHFILDADIDLDPALPGRHIFGQALIQTFTGAFDGNGHTISNLTITGGSYLGLFGQLGRWDAPGGEVKNLGVVDVNIAGSGDNVGGLVGDNHGSIATSYSTGAVSGTEYVGGLVGYNSYGSIASSYSSGTVSGTDWYVGGLVGVNHGTISHCYSTDSVSGGEHGVGGLAGGNFGYIVTSYSSGSVSGTRWDVGGLVGHNEGSIATSYSSGSVSGTGYTVGGLVGYNVSHFTMPGSSFWDIQTSGQIISAGGTGKTTAEMQNIETFLSAGWDFIDEVLNGTCDYWQIAPGDYPRLRYAAGNRPLMPEGRGTVEQPYLIRDARDLGSVWFEPLAHYRLAQSIDLSGITWSMAVIPSFGGSFDGSGYVISHLHIQGANLLGLFGGLGPTASVSKLGLEAVAISGTGRAGGLAGGNEGNIVASYSNGSVSGTDYVIGGLVGSNNGSIVASCNSASVQGYSTVGGLVGENSFGHVAQCCSAGSVSGTDDVGGLVGQNWAGSIATSYSTGLVKGTHWYVGGLVGRSDGGGVTSGFWDTQTSGQTKSAGGTGKTTAEMQTAKTFLEASWDFVGETKNGTNDIWWILEGKDYPKLWWELTPKK